MKTRAKSEETLQREAAHWVARHDRGLTSVEQAEFERWSAAPGNAKAYEAALADWTFLALPKTTGQVSELRAKVREIERAKRRKTLAAGATLAMLLVVGGLSWKTWRDERGVQRPTTVLHVPRREILPDGSKVESAEGAEYAVDFAGTLRRVHLKRGEAMFEVAKDASRPFVVDAAGVEVRAVGTAFTVQLDASKVAVLVTEGKVAVDRARAGDALVKEERTIGALGFAGAGEQLIMDRKTLVPVAPVATVSPADLLAQLAWRHPRLEFSEASLAEVVENVNRCSDLKFEVGDSELGRMKVSGVFPAYDSAMFESVLKRGFGVEVEHVNGKAVIRRAAAR